MNRLQFKFFLKIIYIVIFKKVNITIDFDEYIVEIQNQFYSAIGIRFLNFNEVYDYKPNPTEDANITITDITSISK